ncbi:MAG TPA: archaeosortase/exosortase family protein [Bacteroidia bacterium]
MKNFFDEPIVKFLAFGLLLYLFWLALYQWWIHPKGVLDKIVIDNNISISRYILEWMGYATEIMGNRMMKIQGTPGLYIGDSCNGISLFALYSIFIIAFPGKIVSKIIFIPAGIVLIHFLNVLRVVSLALIETRSYAWTEFNHTYTFTILIYALIFLIWIIWINKFSGFKKKADQ